LLIISICLLQSLSQSIIVNVQSNILRALLPIVEVHFAFQ